MILKDQDKSFSVSDLDKLLFTEEIENGNVLNKTHYMRIHPLEDGNIQRMGTKSLWILV